MNRRIASISAVALLIIAGAAYFLQTDDPAPVSSSLDTPNANRAQLEQGSRQLNSKATHIEPQKVAGENFTDATPAVGSADKFEVDPTGHLVINENTRLHIESIVALTDASQVDSKTEEEVKDLPRGAAARAHDLVERYRVYMIAQKQAYPPGVPPADVDDMLSQQDGLHALRIAHFGEETAEAFYGSEEQTNRELLELMRLEKDKGLSLEEKAERAQALLDKQHREVAAKKQQ